MEHVTQFAPQKKYDIAIIDTNVLLKDPYAAYSLDAERVVIPFTVIEELDSLRHISGIAGRNSRESLRMFEQLRQKGNLNSGVPLTASDHAPIIQIINTDRLAGDHHANDMEDMILAIAFHYKQEGKKTIVCSQDMNVRLKASAKGIESREHISLDSLSALRESLAPVTTVEVGAKALKELTNSKVVQHVDITGIKRNQFVHILSANNPENMRVFRFLGGTNFREVPLNKNIFGPFGAQNIEQSMALDVLTDPDISLVSLLGIAGSGKTFLAILSAISQMFQNRLYERLVVTRPTVSLGPDIGFLPGDMNDKINQWMQPIYDNLNVITEKTQSHEFPMYINTEDLINNNQLIMEAMTFMRGRSLPKQFIIIDEAQNLNSLEVKTLITRAGHGTKVVLAGDPEQIDTPKLGYENNGLVLTSKKFAGDPLFAAVQLKASERSRLAQRAAELL